MSWVNEWGLLTAQTMEFVRSVAGTKPQPEARTEFSTLDEIGRIDKPVAVVPSRQAVRLPRDEVRDEIQGRVAAFRSHQQLFQRERDGYFNSVLAKTRLSTSDQAKLPTTK